MWRKHLVLLSTVLAAALAGCSKSDGTSPDAGTPGGREELRVGNNIDPTTVAQDNGPAGAVFTFLDAVKKGNDEKAASMLTAAARKKTAEMNMEISPPGSDTAQFEIGNVSYTSDAVAQVACKWSDLDQNKKRQADEIVWVVRKDADGWKVSGVAAPVALDFENPKVPAGGGPKQEVAEQEVRKRANEEKSQAQGPENSENSIRR